MQRRLGLGDLDLGGGEARALGPLGEPAGEERLAGAVLAADGLEGRAAPRDRGELVVDRRGEPVEADGEQVEPRCGHGAAPQRVDHLPPARRADRSTHDVHLELQPQQVDVELDGAAGDRQDRVALDVEQPLQGGHDAVGITTGATGRRGGRHGGEPALGRERVDHGGDRGLVRSAADERLLGLVDLRCDHLPAEGLRRCDRLGRGEQRPRRSVAGSGRRVRRAGAVPTRAGRGARGARSTTPAPRPRPAGPTSPAAATRESGVSTSTGTVISASDAPP